MNKIWYDKAWEDLMYWHENNRRMFEKIKALLKCIDRGNVRVGKAEILKGADGFCSMHIDGEHRLVYRIRNNQIEIAQCKTHYTGK